VERKAFTRRWAQACPRRTVRRGAVTVELALVAPLIVFLLFSILEIGYMVKDRAELGQAAREAARIAAVGGTLARMNEGVATSLATIPQGSATAEYQYRPWDEETQTWGSWTDLGTDGTMNNAAPGSQIRVRLNYKHHLLVPGMMSSVLGADENGDVDLTAASVMMRE